MAGSGNLGRLSVDLLLETAQWVTGLNKAEYEAQKFADAVGDKMQKMADKAFDAFKTFAAGAVAAFAVDRIVGFVNEIQKTADALDEMAQKTGTSIDFLAQIGVTAEMSGSSLESISKSMDKLNKATTEAFANDASHPAEVFKALGVEVRKANGELKSSEEVFNEVAKALGGIEDGAIKTAAAQVLFGKSAAELIPTFNALANQSKELTDATKAYGEQMKVLAPIAGALEEQQAILHTKSKAFAALLGEQLIPYITALTESMNKASGAAGTMATPFEMLLNAFKGIVIVIDTVITGLTQLLTILVQGGDAFIKLMQGDLKGASEAARDALANVNAQGQAWLTRVNAMVDPLSTLAENTKKAAKATEELAAAAAGGDAERQKRANAAWVKSIQDGIDAEKALADAIDARNKKSAEAAKHAAAEAKKAREEGDKGWVALIDKQIEDDKKLGEQRYQEALKTDARILEAKRAELDAEAKLEKETRELTDKFNLQQIAKHHKELEDQWGELYRNIESAGRSAFDAIFDHTEGGWKGMLNSLKNSFKKILLDYIYSQFAKPFVMKLMASVGGGFGSYAGGALAASGDNSGGFDMGSLFGLGKSAWDKFFGPTAEEAANAQLIADLGGAAEGATQSIGAFEAGLYGIAGGIAGNFAARAWGAGNRGVANATSWGATGATAGAYIGSIVPVLGTAIGAAIGWAIGTIAGIASDPDPDAMRKANFGGTKGAEGVVAQWSGKSKFGEFGFSKGEWLSDADMGDTMKQFISSVTLMDNTLAQFMSPEQVEKVKKRLEDASKQYELGMEHGGVTGLGDIIKDRLKVVASEFNAGLSAFVDGFEGSTEDLTAIVADFLQLTTMSKEFDPAALVAELEKPQTQMGLYQQGRGDLTKATSELDGSADSMNKLVEQMVAFQQATVQMILVIDAAAASMHKMFTDTADAIRMDVMSPEEKYKFLQDRANKNYELMMNETDPQKINELAGKINADINAAWGLLSDDQKGALSEAYLSRLDNLDNVVADKMKALRDVVIDDSKTAMEDIQKKLDEVFKTGKEAADKNNEAADKNLKAANTPIHVVIDVNDPVVNAAG